MNNKLFDLSPLATALQITGVNGGYSQSYGGLVQQANAHEASVRLLAARLHLQSPTFTTESVPLFLLGPHGDTDVRLVSRTGALAHVEILSQTRGSGVWISNVTAAAAQLKPGGTFKLDSQSFNAKGVVTLRVKGIFRSLDQSVLGKPLSKHRPKGQRCLAVSSLPLPEPRSALPGCARVCRPAQDLQGPGRQGLPLFVRLHDVHDRRVARRPEGVDTLRGARARPAVRRDRPAGREVGLVASSRLRPDSELHALGR
jgi:hypothetical protein